MSPEGLAEAKCILGFYRAHHLLLGTIPICFTYICTVKMEVGPSKTSRPMEPHLPCVTYGVSLDSLPPFLAVCSDVHG